MNHEDYAEDTDSSDEDYTPGASAAAGDVPSEVDSDGDSEEPLSDAEDAGTRTKAQRNAKKKPARNGTAATTTVSKEDTSLKSLAEQEAERKKHADDLWASFKEDTNFPKSSSVATTPSTNGNTGKTKIPEVSTSPKEKLTNEPATVKITQLFEFAGEQVQIDKDVRADSAEARLSAVKVPASASAASSSNASQGPKRKTAGLSGIGSVLNQLNKKQKLSVLEKTKLDWNQYKQKEKIEDELESYKKGKDSYLEKQDFLQRADLRRFEIEKEVRAVERSKRTNNS